MSQSGYEERAELIVVDNNSEDDTRKFVTALAEANSSVRYVFEPRLGLSESRNTGAGFAKYKYLAFIDDDGKIRRDFLSHCERIISKYKFKCFGGWFIPWYRTPKPAWLPDDVGTYPKWREDTGPTVEGQDIPGGIFVIEKETLLAVGCFPSGIGMRGGVVGYGEENFVQQKLRSQGIAIGFCPEMILEHLVAEYKYKLSWHLKRQFAMTRDKQVMLGYLSATQITLGILKALVYPIPLLFINLPRFFQRKEYYLQNWILDSLKFPVRTMGAVYSSIVKQ